MYQGLFCVLSFTVTDLEVCTTSGRRKCWPGGVAEQRVRVMFFLCRDTGNCSVALHGD